MTQNFNIIVSCDDKYAKFSAVTLTSIIHKTKRQQSSDNSQKYIFHILTNGFSEETQNKFIALEEKLNTIFPCTISIHTLSDDLFAGFEKWGGQYAAYYRLVLSKVLPDDIEKVLYLDSDLLVNADVRELFAIDMKGATVGVIEDPFQPLELCSLHGNSPLAFKERYFNSGVLLVDTARWKDTKVEEKSFDILRNYKVNYADQDALNAISIEKVFLPKAWNFMPNQNEPMGKDTLFDPAIVLDSKKCYERLENLTINIIHYVGIKKPWQVMRSMYRKNYICLDHTAFNTYWWYMASQATPFYDEIIKYRDTFDFKRTYFIAKLRQFLVKNDGFLLKIYKKWSNYKLGSKQVKN